MRTKNKIAIATLLLCGGLVAGVGFGLLAVATVLTIWSGIAYVVKNKQVIKED